MLAAAERQSAVEDEGDTPSFLFSGQGSQHGAWARALTRGESPVSRRGRSLRATFLEPHLKLDLRQVVFGGDAEGTLNETRLTQPALFATEYALASLWMSWGVTPSAMLGHSIGEYVGAPGRA